MGGSLSAAGYRLQAAGYRLQATGYRLPVRLGRHRTAHRRGEPGLAGRLQRPHEGIGDRTPASLWTASARDYPARFLPPDYPAHLEVRRISTAGTFRLHSRQPFLTRVLEGEDIGLDEVADVNIVYDRTLLGRLDERTLLITGV